MAKRKDGLCEIKRMIEMPDGSKKAKHFYGKTKKDAIKDYEQYLIKINTEKNKPSVAYFEEVADLWLKTKETAVQYHTYKGYEYKVSAQKEYFKDRLISSISHSDIQIFLGKQSGQSINTVRKHKIYLKAIFDIAMRNHYIIDNPMVETKLPKCKAAKEPRAYSKKQARMLIDHAKTQGINGLSVFIPLKTGLRPGEVIALNVGRDIDFEGKNLHVCETVKAPCGGKKVGDPKTDKSVRDIPVDDEFLDHIKSFDFEGYIFDNGRGVPKNYNNWKTRNFDRLMESAPEDVPIYDPHEMRHTYGTLLYECGTDLYTIMKVMGHSDIKVTQIYVHQSVETVREKLKLDF